MAPPYRFGRRSEERLARLHPDLVAILRDAIKVTDLAILTTARGPIEQNEAFASGASLKRWPFSRHNAPIVDPDRPRAEWREDPTGIVEAVDVAPWFPAVPHIRWEARESFAYLAGVISGIALMRGIPITYGHDWNRNGVLDREEPARTLQDLGHFELYRGPR